MRVATLAFCENFFDELNVHESLEYARGYALGFRQGAGKYGAGRTLCLVMPEDMDELNEHEDGISALKAYERWCYEEELRMTVPPRD